MTRSLMSLLDNDPSTRRVGRGDQLTEAQYLATLEGVAPIFRETSKRNIVPVTIVNDPGVLKSRHLSLTDIAAAEAGMRGTGGTYDHMDMGKTEVPVLAIWKNVEMRYRDLQTSRRGGIDLWQQAVQAATERVVQKENTLLVAGIGAIKGLTNTSGIQTFASAGAWTTDGIAYKDIATALFGKLANVNAPIENAALLVNPLDAANLYTFITNENQPRINALRTLLPGGIETSSDVTQGKAYVYSKTPTVVEYRVYQDLSLIDLPQSDEDERLRVRVMGALHVKKPTGIVEITSVDV